MEELQCKNQGKEVIAFFGEDEIQKLQIEVADLKMIYLPVERREWRSYSSRMRSGKEADLTDSTTAEARASLNVLSAYDTQKNLIFKQRLKLEI